MAGLFRVSSVPSLGVPLVLLALFASVLPAAEVLVSADGVADGVATVTVVRGDDPATAGRLQLHFADAVPDWAGEPLPLRRLRVAARAEGGWRVLEDLGPVAITAEDGEGVSLLGEADPELAEALREALLPTPGAAAREPDLAAQRERIATLAAADFPPRAVPQPVRVEVLGHADATLVRILAGELALGTVLVESQPLTVVANDGSYAVLSPVFGAPGGILALQPTPAEDVDE